MGLDACDRGAVLHLREGAPEHRGHHEDVGHAVAVQRLGEEARAGHAGHRMGSPGLGAVP